MFFTMALDDSNFTYSLPQERIALYPLKKRDQSKLLVYDRGEISHQTFTDLSNYLPAGSTLFFNETKVIPARLYFQKTSGATIEIFLLNPILPSALLLDAMQAQSECRWKCTIGNLKRWPDDVTLSTNIGEIVIEANLQNRDEGIVDFRWTGTDTFASLLQRIGSTPLPPYLKRDAETSDKDRYQTVYSSNEGAVAAPTAGLHFTDAVFKSLREKKMQTDFLTLHVSAGTFQPIKVKNPLEHTMHQEQIIVSRKNVETVLQSKCVVAVGTTSLRTLESLYWFGAKLIQHSEATFNIGQDEPYQIKIMPSRSEALRAVLQWMDTHQCDAVTGHTSIYIVPGYTFRICQALITNFHQPASTLILLVAAFIGSDWKRVYDEALQHGYRFLSYGDSSLLIPGRYQ